MTRYLRLGVNIDHVATIRNARGGRHPDPVQAALLAEQAGADGITAHLREDRRHISDDDITRLIEQLTVPLNFEIAATDEMLDIALRHSPHAACLVPEKREEITTEGGLDVIGGHNHLAPFVRQLSESGSRVSMFIDPELDQLRACADIGAPVIELHAGAYCDAESNQQPFELERLQIAAIEAERLGLECHVGHGLTFDTVVAVAEIPNVVELNIGHFLIGEAIFGGLDGIIKRMRSLMDLATSKASA
jgi:pyridoxine 5-phosphate synthase